VPRSGIVTLLTDFGTEDYFVGAMKGVVLKQFPGAVLVDITHHIPRHDISAAAFALSAACRNFPPGTVHLAVVDPGVGTNRRPLIVESEEHFFVGPDNGIFSLVLRRDRNASIRMITNAAFFLPEISFTFHGRDIFSPVAAALGRGEPIGHFGPAIDDPVCFESYANELTADGSLKGSVLHIDHFGNCVTSFFSNELRITGVAKEVRLRAKGYCIERVCESYQEGAAKEGVPFLIVGSAGYLEISIAQSSAARELNLVVGEPLFLEVF
jgi:S-adenosyl-L-methionine hydrolase (adenosine-forming)